MKKNDIEYKEENDERTWGDYKKNGTGGANKTSSSTNINGLLQYVLVNRSKIVNIATVVANETMQCTYCDKPINIGEGYLDMETSNGSSNLKKMSFCKRCIR
jgi:hypothetical protein